MNAGRTNAKMFETPVLKNVPGVDTACSFDFCLHLTHLGPARQFIETCGMLNLLCES